MVTQSEAEAIVRKEKEEAPKGSGTAALSEEGIRRKASSIVKKSTSKSRSFVGEKREVKITQLAPLTDKEIIEQNKKLLSDLEEKRTVAANRGDRAAEKKFTAEYNAIARQSNQAIKKENVNISKAATTVQFANLYTPEKASAIVEASGLKEYIIKNPAPPKVESPAVVNKPKKDRFIYDKENNIYIDTFNTGSGSVFGAADFDRRSVSFNLRPEDKTFKEKVKSSISEGIGFFNVQESKAGKKSETYKGLSGGVAFGSAFILSAGSQPLRAVSNPFNYFVEGTAELVADPVGSAFSIVENIGKPSFSGSLVGGVAVSYGLSKTPKTVVKIVNKGRLSYTNYKLESGRVYDTNYNFNSERGFSAFGKQGEVLPSKQTVLYSDTLFIESPPNSLRPYDYTSKQTVLARPTELVRTGAYRYKIVEPAERITLESGKVEIRPTPSYQEVLRSRRLSQEAAAKGSETPFYQKSITDISNEIGTTTDPFFAVKTSDSSFILQGKPLFPKGKKGSATIGVSKTERVLRGEDLYSEFDEGRSSPNFRASDPLIDSPSVVPSGSFKPFVLTPFALPPTTTGTQGGDTGFIRVETPVVITKPSGTLKPSDKPIFSSVSERDLYQGFKANIDSRSDNREGSAFIVVSAQDNAQSQELTQSNELTSSQRLTGISELIPDNFNKPVRSISNTNKPYIPPPVLNKPSIQVENGFKRGFNVFVRREGKFSRVNNKALRFEEAQQLGASVVGTSAAATFKLEETKSNRLGSFSGSGNLKDFYRKGSLYIEKRSKRIKSSGEKEEITLKGLSALRFGKKRRSIF